MIDVVTRLLGWLKRKQRIRVSASPVKVNLGSGLTVASGWINVDASLNALFAAFPAPLLRMLYRFSGSRHLYTRDEYLQILKDHHFVFHNLEYGVPFRDDSVDCLYSSHMLEHMTKEDAQALTNDAFRILKKGGLIRLCVPDLAYAVSLYQAGEKEDALRYFFAPSREGYAGRHKYMYDFELLRDLLVRAGFVHVRKVSYRTGNVPDLDELDNREHETLFVEARKP